MQPLSRMAFAVGLVAAFTGCTNNLSDPAAKFSTKVSDLATVFQTGLDGMNGAHAATAATIEAQKLANKESSDLRYVPLLSDEAVAERNTVLNSLKAYALDLSTLLGANASKERTEAAKSLGSSAKSFAATTFPTLSSTDKSLLEAGVRWFGEAVLNAKLASDLPPIMARAAQEMTVIADVLAKDVADIERIYSRSVDTDRMLRDKLIRHAVNKGANAILVRQEVYSVMNGDIEARRQIKKLKSATGAIKAMIAAHDALQKALKEGGDPSSAIEYFASIVSSL